jgi:hypothetical protein
MSKIAFVIVSTALLSVVHFFLSCKVDFLIAERMGDIRQFGEGGWTSYGNISWTFTSLLGPALALHRYAFLGLAILSGLSCSLLVAGTFMRTRLFPGSSCWIFITVVLTWVLRIPVPMKYSLYYFTTVRY